MPPTVGTQVVVLSLGGYTIRGLILAGLFASAPPLSNFEVDVSGEGNAVVPDGDVTASGGDVIAEGVSLVTHVQGHVVSGTADVSSPTQNISPECKSGG